MEPTFDAGGAGWGDFSTRPCRHCASLVTSEAVDGPWVDGPWSDTPRLRQRYPTGAGPSPWQHAAELCCTVAVIISALVAVLLR
ncbi:hypothetical protein ACF1G0_23175 [Streptomyces sp. NPDC013953]|uniref:hypothetical protein n=1 Tax=Streptomyces sp. NPDC013953 TaxID=3364868 RepID=UPI0036FD22DB